MKTNFNSTDGFYFFLLLIPFALSLWLGDLLRIKIQATNWNHKLSIIVGICVEILIASAGVLVGFLLVKFLAAST